MSAPPATTIRSAAPSTRTASATASASRAADGWIWVNRDDIKASDRELLTKPLPEDAERLYVSNDHMGNFFDCMRSRKDPICAVEIGHRSASVCHLGAISLRTGKNLQWDPEKEVFTGENAKRGEHLHRPRNAQALRLQLRCVTAWRL